MHLNLSGDNRKRLYNRINITTSSGELSHWALRYYRNDHSTVREDDMFRLDADRPVEFCDGLRRRDFLHAGSLTALGLGLTQLFGL